MGPEAMITRQFIVEEIKRLTAENGGVPPGMDTFLRETGLKAYDIVGKYWARWGDAVREAGFIPHEFGIVFEDDMIIEKLVGLIKELGAFPIQSQLALKRREDRQFPSEKAFRRFGKKAGLASKVLEFCQQREELNDVARICTAIIQSAESTVRTDSAQEGGDESENIGFVYLLKSGRFHKIGRSKDASRREYELGIQLPDKASMVHVIRTDDPVGIEAYWHKRFDAKRANGEWFQLSASDVKVFKRRKFM